MHQEIRMNEIADRVLAETHRFYEALPRLADQYRDRWVVFRDGQVQSDHSSEDEAYEEAVGTYGPKGGFVVALVAEVSPIPLTAAVAFE
jgi:hypothetical protein